METAKAVLDVAEAAGRAEIDKAKAALDAVTTEAHGRISAATRAFAETRDVARVLQEDLQARMSGMLDTSARVRVS